MGNYIWRAVWIAGAAPPPEAADSPAGLQTGSVKYKGMTQTAYPAHHRWSPEPKQYKNKHIFPPRQCQVNLAVASNLLHFFILHNLQPGSRAKHCIPLYPFCFGEQPVRAFRWMGGWQAIKDSINGFQALIIQQLICFRESLQAKSPGRIHLPGPRHLFLTPWKTPISRPQIHSIFPQKPLHLVVLSFIFLQNHNLASKLP